jgi:hypothetical protein
LLHLGTPDMEHMEIWRMVAEEEEENTEPYSD